MDLYYSLSPEVSGPEDLLQRNLLYIKIRWYLLLVLGAGGLLAAVRLKSTAPSPTKILFLIAIVAAFNLFFYLLTHIARRKSTAVKTYINIALFQVILDIVSISYCVYLDGGEASKLFVLYVLPIVISSGLFARSIIYFTAFFSMFAYFFVSFVYVVNRTLAIPDAGSILKTAFFATSFLFIAYLADYLYSLRHQREVELAQTEMVSLASHQLRTPATAVKGYLSFLLEGDVGKLNPKQLDFAKRAFDENNIQLRLIDNILNVARIDLKRLHFAPRMTDLSVLIEEVVHEHLAIIGERGQSISFKPHTKNTQTAVDPQLMRIVVDNLISNASKYSGKDGKISVKLFGDKQFVKFSVEDNGVGIATFEQKKLFKRFSRIFSNQRTEVIEGSGLGLYLTKELVKIHHGSIDLVSYPKEGSIFTITLPRKEALK